MLLSILLSLVLTYLYYYANVNNSKYHKTHKEKHERSTHKKKADAPQDDDGRSLGDREENKTLALARKVIDGITDSDAFFDAAIEGDIYVNDISNPAYLELMGAMTKDYVQKRQNLFTAPQLAAIETFGTAPYAQHQQRLLDNTKQRMSREEINHAKDTLVEYNARIARTLREFQTTPPETLAFNIALVTSDKLSGSRDKLHNDAMRSLRGMRMENMFEDLVSSAGIDIRHGDAREERRGVDFVVSPVGARPLEIDIKASLDEVAGKNKGYDESGRTYAQSRDNKFTFFPYATDTCFVNNSSELDTELAPQIQQLTLNAIEDMTRQK